MSNNDKDNNKVESNATKQTNKQAESSHDLAHDKKNTPKKRPGHLEGKSLASESVLGGGAHSEAVIGVAAQNDTDIPELGRDALIADYNQTSKEAEQDKTPDAHDDTIQPEQNDIDASDQSIKSRVTGATEAIEPESHILPHHSSHRHFVETPFESVNPQHPEEALVKSPSGFQQGIATNHGQGPDGGPHLFASSMFSKVSPYISGPQQGQVVEDQLGKDTDQGDLTRYSGTHAFSTTQLSGQYGELKVDADGHWVYQLDNQNTNTQSLSALQRVDEVFQVRARDGSQHEVHILVQGTDDTPVITSIASQTVQEGGALLNGRIGATDVDTGDKLSFSSTATIPGFALNSDGAYTFDPAVSEYNQLGVGQTRVIHVPVTVTDTQGATATQTLQITITGTNDGPTMSTVPPLLAAP